MAMPSKEPKLKLTLKKTYCPVDMRLVRVKEVMNGNQITLACNHCGAVLWRREGAMWQAVANRLPMKRKP
ncbi:hypothetical protein [Dehalogenimonas etheniformans]|uniref:Uncharacterized protein n=1 Tax=Dehalogenimonas etheniformans TaxID=1536648 RepID=A0A2P5P4Z1_9CHLR|nr:hypothetical protein [Dehalogenimonas etheniformans]PPD57356.1 hypothetical protein JP09_009965 [Dehalogenimonas etheniformans]QNT75205.1 hypothetical protein HX448_00105 [Dehalogenimonas etheniformans]